MKTFVSLVLLTVTAQSMASDCRRIEMHIQQLQEQLYQCQQGDSPYPDHNSTVCSIEKSSYWELKVAGSNVLSSYEFESVAKEAINKEKNNYCRFQRPDCTLSKDSYWHLKAAGSDILTSYEFENLAKKAQEHDMKGYCRFLRPSCTIEKGSYWELKVDGGSILSSYEFDNLARKKNELVAAGLCR